MFDTLSKLSRNLAGLVVELDDPVVNPATVPVQPIAQPSVSGVVASSAYDQDMYTSLQKTVMGRKTPYTALLESSEKLRSIIPDDTTRVKAAFVSAADGRTPADVLKSIDVHISDLEGERARFAKSSDQQIVQRCATPRQLAQEVVAQIDIANQAITDYETRIVNLKTDIENFTSKSQQMLQDAAAAETEIQQVSEKFNKTVEYAKNELAVRKQQLSTILS
jgi:chromosome segregation ATPase